GRLPQRPHRAPSRQLHENFRRHAPSPRPHHRRVHALRPHPPRNHSSATLNHRRIRLGRQKAPSPPRHKSSACPDSPPRRIRAMSHASGSPTGGPETMSEAIGVSIFFNPPVDLSRPLPDTMYLACPKWISSPTVTASHTAASST